MITSTATTIDEYIAAFPKPIQVILTDLRNTIKKACPEAGEVIKYHMPTFTFHGNMLSFGVFKNHIGLYPAPLGTEKFNEQLAPYRSGKATVRFLFNEPLPHYLITELVKLRVKTSLEKAAKKELNKRIK